MEYELQTSESENNRLTSRKTWMRGLFMLVFAVAFGIGQAIIMLVAVVQFLWLLFGGQTNQNLLKFGRSLSSWIADVTKYLTGVSEEMPFPWSEWPSNN